MCTRPFGTRADSSCNLCCCCAEKPDHVSAFIVTQQFCVSNRQSCEEISVCGRYIDSAENCKRAVLQLPLVRDTNRTVLTLNNPRAPKGCLLDSELHTYFNADGTSESDYAGLMSVCSVQDKKGDSNTPPAISHDHGTHSALQMYSRCRHPSKKQWKHAVRTSHC